MRLPNGSSGHCRPVRTRSNGRFIGGTGFSAGPSSGPLPGASPKDPSGAICVELCAEIAFFGVMAGIGHPIIGEKISTGINRMEGGCHGA